MSLTSFLKKCPSLTKIVFAAEIRCITYEDEGDSYAANKLAGDFFIRYIQEVNQRHSDETIK